MNRVKIPEIASGQRASWLALIEIANILPDDWTLIGGQLVQLTDSKVISEIRSAIGRILTRPDLVAQVKGSAGGLQQLGLLLA